MRVKSPKNAETGSNGEKKMTEIRQSKVSGRTFNGNKRGLSLKSNEIPDGRERSACEKVSGTENLSREKWHCIPQVHFVLGRAL